MKKLTAFAAAAALLGFAACRKDNPMGPGGGDPTLSRSVRGDVVASTYCTPCHGTTLLGGSTANGVATPSLVAARQYTSAQFDVLLVAGLTRDGHYVRDNMTSTRITGISAAERHALYDYLVNTWTP